MKRLLVLCAVIVLGVGATFGVLYSKAKKADMAVQEPAIDKTGTRYLPLGDSYTIGESVLESQRWPNQLVSRLKKDGVSMQIVASPALTGFTSQDLIDRELPLLKTQKPEFVSIQIGVNDYVQKVPVETYQKNLEFIVAETLKVVPKNRVILVTVPDFARTPVGKSFGDPAKSTEGVMAINGVIQEVGRANGVEVIDIFEISKIVLEKPGYTAHDGLHPSDTQYKLWVDAIAPRVHTLLKM